MDGLLIRTALRKSLAQVLYVSVVPAARARDLVATVYARMDEDFGLVAPVIAVHSPAPELLAASWGMLRETLVAGATMDRTTKEAVATSVSLGNACGSCVELHLTLLQLLNERRDAEAGLDNSAIAAADQLVRHACDWARTSGTRAAARRAVPFPAGQIPELVGTMVVVNYLNRMASVFLPETSVPAGVTAGGRVIALRLLGQLALRAAGRPHAAGASADLLPAAPLPTDLFWAKGNPAIASAFASAVSVLEAAAARTVPEPVRVAVRQQISTWDGESVGQALTSPALDGLAPADVPVARLALLVALAPHRVDASMIADYRRTHPGDRPLLELAAWASMTAARRVGVWAAGRQAIFHIGHRSGRPEGDG